MPGKRDVPEIVEHVVAALVKDKGYDRKTAWHIAVGHLQKIGVLKKGTLDLTEKGKKLNEKHLKEPKKVRVRKIALAIGKSPVAVASKLYRK